MPHRPTPHTPGVEDPGPGRRLGLDVGTARIGVAVSNYDATMAMPVETVRRSSGFSGPDRQDIDRITDIATYYEIAELVVGLPRNLDGSGSISVKHAKEIGFRMRRRFERLGLDIPVRFVDERLTTVIATQALHAAGLSTRQHRSVIDQAASVEILQSWLDARARQLGITTENPDVPAESTENSTPVEDSSEN